MFYIFMSQELRGPVIAGAEVDSESSMQKSPWLSISSSARIVFS